MRNALLSIVAMFGLLCLVPACHPSVFPDPPPFPEADSGVDASDAAAAWDGTVDPPEGLDAARLKDAGGDICAQACAALRAIPCQEGLDVNCAAVCRKTNGVLTDLKPACLAASKTAAQARACGSVRCGKK